MNEGWVHHSFELRCANQRSRARKRIGRSRKRVATSRRRPETSALPSRSARFSASTTRANIGSGESRSLCLKVLDASGPAAWGNVIVDFFPRRGIRQASWCQRFDRARGGDSGWADRGIKIVRDSLRGHVKALAVDIGPRTPFTGRPSARSGLYPICLRRRGALCDRAVL